MAETYRNEYDDEDGESLSHFDVLYRQSADDTEGEPHTYRFHAEDAEHAKEQALNAEPGIIIVDVRPTRGG